MAEKTMILRPNGDISAGVKVSSNVDTFYGAVSEEFADNDITAVNFSYSKGDEINVEDYKLKLSFPSLKRKVKITGLDLSISCRSYNNDAKNAGHYSFIEASIICKNPSGQQFQTSNFFYDTDQTTGFSYGVRSRAASEADIEGLNDVLEDDSLLAVEILAYARNSDTTEYESVNMNLTQVFLTLKIEGGFLKYQNGEWKEVHGELYRYTDGAWEQKNVTDLDKNGFILKKLETDIDNYTRLEYIESSGTQWIDTNILVSPTTRVEIEYMPLSYDGAVFGSEWNEQGFFLADWQTDILFRSGGDTFDIGNTIFNKKRYIVCELLSCSVDGVVEIELDDTVYNNTTYPIYLLWVGSKENPDKKGVLRLYSCKIYDKGVLVRNYKPVLDSNNKAGLYDTVSKTFYVSLGDTDFIAGPNL